MSGETKMVIDGQVWTVDMEPESVGEDGSMMFTVHVRDVSDGPLPLFVPLPGDRIVNPDGTLKPRSEWPKWDDE